MTDTNTTEVHTADPSSGAATAAPAAAEEVRPDYNTAVTEAVAALRQECRRSERSKWTVTIAVHRTVRSLYEGYAAAQTRKRICADVARELALNASTVKKWDVLCGRLTDCDLLEDERVRRLGVDRVSEILVSSGLDDDAQLVLLKETCDRAAKDLKSVTVRSIRREIRSRKPKTDRGENWLRDSDYWGYTDFDPRFGQEAHPRRSCGQVALNVVHHWLPADGRFLSALCGDGAALDAVRHLRPECDYRGFDLDVDEVIRFKHGDRVVEFDPVSLDWRGAVPAGWQADLVMLTPPIPDFSDRDVREMDLAGRTGLCTDFVRIWQDVAASVRHVVRPGGILAVVTPNSPEFEEFSPLADLEYRIVHAFHDAGTVEKLLARVVIRVGNAGHAEQAAPGVLFPETQRLHVFRVASQYREPSES